MSLDLKNSVTHVTIAAPLSRATNNVASAGLDLQQFIGVIGVRVALGVKTIGDNDGAITVTLQHAANNVAGEAVTLAVGNVATTNNTAASGTLAVDTRATFRYLFARIVLAGTNSPAYPVSIEAVGLKQVQ
ncbi:MAG: hypothetical protein QOE70_4372 [Chthoniobacter sp.]|jgi:hypothetical protein|nr:hypothetical protein [Chthoniobacter sp.]